MTTKSILFSLLTLGTAATASAAVYVDVRASRLELSGTPNIGDIGATISEDRPSSAITLAIGYDLTSRLALELRYSRVGDAHIDKVAPTASAFPTNDPTAQVQTFYRFDQTTELYTLALPIKLVEKGDLSVSVAPLLHLERSDFTFTNTGVNTLLLPGPLPVIYRDSRTPVHLGAEVKLAYRLTPHVGASLHYNYSALEAYDAHLFGAGLDFRF